MTQRCPAFSKKPSTCVGLSSGQSSMRVFVAQMVTASTDEDILAWNGAPSSSCIAPD